MIRRLLRLIALLLVGFASCALLVACCGKLVLPFGYSINSPDLFSRGGGKPVDESVLTQRIQVPPGFAINTYFAGLPNPRVLRFSAAGDLLVSSPRERKILLLRRDANADGKADGVQTLLADLNDPHGFVLHGGWLYVAETDAIVRIPFDSDSGTVSGTPERFIRGFPGGGNHWRRVIDVGPDGWLYLAIGSSCNVCIEEDPRRAAISRFRLDGSGEELFATGLRNSAGFAWRPGTNEMYATDNGRDLLGDDFPPCELNRVVPHGFYGWPHVNGTGIPDPEFGSDQAKVAQALPPALAFGAHNAPLGITFYTGDRFPERYRGNAFVALHGSWNRSSKEGYKVVALFFDSNGTIGQEDFLSGFERDENVIGRPAYSAVGPDGALYVSDDYAGSIYRVAYGAAGAATLDVAAPAAKADPLAELSADELHAADERGRVVFDQFPCASCHLQPETGTPVLAKLRTKYDIDSLAAFLRSPQPPMPQFPMSDAQRRDLAIHLLQRFP